MEFIGRMYWLIPWMIKRVWTQPPNLKLKKK